MSYYYHYKFTSPEQIYAIVKEELKSDGSKCEDCELSLKILWNMSLLRENKESMKADSAGLVQML